MSSVISAYVEMTILLYADVSAVGNLPGYGSARNFCSARPRTGEILPYRASSYIFTLEPELARGRSASIQDYAH
jgi:hypothetical protein